MRARAEKRRGYLRRDIEQMFAVVQDDERRLVAEGVTDRFEQSAPGLVTHTHGRCQCVVDHVVLRHRGEIDHPDAVGELVDRLRRRLQSQSRFAGSADAGERQQPVHLEQAENLGKLGIAADEVGQLNRQIVRHCVERAERWEFGL